jgi:ABC-type uncharacterized transport system substrate-binding protein
MFADVAIEFRWAEGNYERLTSQADDLVRSQIAVLVATGGTTSVLAAKAATSTVPIVLSAHKKYDSLLRVDSHRPTSSRAAPSSAPLVRSPQ